jgi:segregation and condensation protein B
MSANFDNQTSHVAQRSLKLELADGQEAGAIGPEDLGSLLEALLLVSPEPARLADLANAAGATIDEVIGALEAINRDQRRGLVVVQHKGTAHLTSAPRFAAHIRRFLRIEREVRLSGAALETLALIAYRQPVTRAEIEALRGVDSSGVLATLHSRGLIEIAGRLPTVGNPIQYATTIEFLRQFGLKSLDELPPLDQLAGRIAEQLFAETGEPAAPGSVDAPSP